MLSKGCNRVENIHEKLNCYQLIKKRYKLLEARQADTILGLLSPVRKSSPLFSQGKADV